MTAAQLWAFRAGWWEGRCDAIRTSLARLVRLARRHPGMRKAYEVREAAAVANKLFQLPPWEKQNNPGARSAASSGARRSVVGGWSEGASSRTAKTNPRASHRRRHVLRSPRL